MIDAARGMTVAQSAASRHVSINTVKVMIRKSRKRLGGQNITHAVALAIIAGDITPQDLEGSS